eukprot:967671-Karenia_brevis.AAC.1
MAKQLSAEINEVKHEITSRKAPEQQIEVLQAALSRKRTAIDEAMQQRLEITEKIRNLRVEIQSAEAQ